MSAEQLVCAHEPPIAGACPLCGAQISNGIRSTLVDGDRFISLDDLFAYFEWAMALGDPAAGELVLGGGLLLLSMTFPDDAPTRPSTSEKP
jgi:hypothetical protein